ncbi:uncharacterized protein LOC113582013 [Electrophorus electricus]|uniref:uncharacterized protein LOC113582013 n=1 Tax=Electrophorus electricus TaxID=8005 RepID=UPI0015D0C618|nr:uncharacterized protein LOC113582013 [Electrophorus electricus]
MQKLVVFPVLLPLCYAVYHRQGPCTIRLITTDWRGRCVGNRPLGWPGPCSTVRDGILQSFQGCFRSSCKWKRYEFRGVAAGSGWSKTVLCRGESTTLSELIQLAITVEFLRWTHQPLQRASRPVLSFWRTLTVNPRADASGSLAPHTQERARRFARGLCLCCGANGHFRDYCPVRPREENERTSTFGRHVQQGIFFLLRYTTRNPYTRLRSPAAC